MNTVQNKRLHLLLTQLDALSHKADFAWHASYGRTMHTSELTDQEAGLLIEYLQTKATQVVEVKPKVGDRINRIRRRLISMFVEMGAIDPFTGKADMKLIYKLVREHWQVGLNEMNQTQLSKVIAVVEKRWLPWYYKRRESPGFRGLKELGPYESELRFQQ